MLNLNIKLKNNFKTLTKNWKLWIFKTFTWKKIWN